MAATAVVAGSTEGGGEEEGAPSSLSSSTPALKLKKRQRRTVTGGLKNLPIALPAVELLNRALRTAKYLKVRGLDCWIIYVVGLGRSMVTQIQLIQSTPPCPLPLSTPTPPIHGRSTRIR